MVNLIIVESYSKTKTISNYLNNYNNDKYLITSSLGHICNLPKNNLGINIDTWKCTYEVSNKKIVKNIRNLVKKCDNIYIASDPDIEGEAIAYHIKNHIKDLLKNKKCYRIRFNEITKNSIINALNNPSNIDINIVNAQETRRILDRLIGFKLSPILWKKFNNYHLSVGRVQSVALSICIDLLDNINKYQYKKLWNVIGTFKLSNNDFNDTLKCSLYQNNNLVILDNDDECIKRINNPSDEWNIKLKKSSYNKSPSEPYTTTSLQKDAYNILNFTSNKTMIIAKLLYELGLITYIRTDSLNISDDFKKNIWDYIDKNYGKSYIFKRCFKNKIVNAQEAHEAIRITNTELKDLDNITIEHIKLYNLIWKRTIACQMIDAINCVIEIKIYNKDNIFITSKTLLEKEGYLKVYDKNIDNKNQIDNLIDNYKNSIIKNIELECIPYISNKISLYNEIELIKELEKEGIGRPSTYNGIIDKLLEKNYVIKGTNPIKEININSYKKSYNNDNIIIINNYINIFSNKKDLLVPTEIGIKIIEYLKNIIPFILDKQLTSNMENKLDLIVNKKTKKNNILNEFYNKILPYI